MVDFRYHLVSLIAVFLALALGITLGAGVLQTGIGNSLSGDLETVRTERDDALAQVQDLEREVSVRDAAVTVLGTDAADGVLAGRTIAVVVMPGAEEADVTAAREAATAAGAATTTAWFTDTWMGVDQSYLQSYSGQLGGYVEAGSETRPEGVVAAALATALAGTGDAAVLRELLSADEVDFVTFDGEGDVPAEAIVVVGPRTQTELPEGAAPREGASMVAGFAGVLPTVTLGAATAERDGLVDQVRAADVATSTVDSVGEAPATVAVPLALAAELAGTSAHYGSESGANAPIPTVP
ncbi:MAG: copper transporter [bacterium]|nr:copper transporter [bacterium]